MKARYCALFLMTTLFFAHPGLVFGSDLPNLVIGGQIVPFDEKYVVSDEVAPALRSLITAYVDAAMRAGVHSIGGVELTRLKKEFESVKLVFIRSGVSVMGAGKFAPRMGSVFIKETQTIYVSLDTAARISNGRDPRSSDLSPLLSLMSHEFFGAIGYDDENYQASSLLLTASTQPDLVKKITAQNRVRLHRFDGPIRREMIDFRSSTTTRSKGGVTVVGGGGDEILFAAKIYMANELKRWWEEAPLLFARPEMKALGEGYAKDFTPFFTDETLTEFAAYFFETPIEPMTIRHNSNWRPLSDVSGIEEILGFYENEKSRTFLRLSREHWNWPIGSASLEESRKTISHVALTQLFVGFLRDTKRVSFEPDEIP